MGISSGWATCCTRSSNTDKPNNHYFDTFEQDQTSIELQISGTSLSDKLEWLIGLYVFDEDGENINPVDFTTVSIQSGGYFDYQSEAAFAQLTFRPNEAFSMTLDCAIRKRG